MVALFSPGSGGYSRSCSSAKAASSISSTPGWTVTVRFSVSSDRISFIFVVSSRMPPQMGTAAPTSPVPLPRTVTGMTRALARRIISETSRVVRTRTRTSGMWDTSPSSSWA